MTSHRVLQSLAATARALLPGSERRWAAPFRTRSARVVEAIAVAMAIALGARPSLAIPAADANSVLILEDTVSNGLSSIEATKAAALGYTVEVATAAQWGAATAAEFATYRALILGDATCTGIGAVANAVANRGVWSLAVVGNIVVIGTDPTYHSTFGPGGAQGGDFVPEKGIAFAASGSGTGLYATLSCYYHGTAPMTPVPLLDQFGPFSVTGVGCYDDAHIVAVHPALAGLTDANLSNWGCSVHEAFDSFPGGFAPLAIAENISGPGSLGFPDGTFGIPYIVARGAATVGCGDGTVQPPEQCDDGNATPGDGCSEICKFEICGDGIRNVGEQCDDGNATSGDGCSATCTLESCGNGALDAGEQCDDGNTAGGDGCSDICRFEICGDGLLNVGEECDDGNTSPGDGCSASCSLESAGPTSTPTDTRTVTPTVTPTATPTVTSPVGPCPSTPTNGCFSAGATDRWALKLDNGSDDRDDRMAWKWRGDGPGLVGNLGDPTAATSYAFCLYAGASPTLVMAAQVPAGAPWRAQSGRGFRLQSSSGGPDGITKAVLRANPARTRAQLYLRGRGANLPLPAMPLAEPVLAQLIKSDGPECWESRYSGATRNTATKFHDRAD